MKWKSFDGKEISGWLYAPKVKPASGQVSRGDQHSRRARRPVAARIFLGRTNYLINDLGVAVIFPNVRGSTGYGKTFSQLDNGFLREDTYKDIGALLDWIGQQPDLDAKRVMVTGGSYGGHMTLAVATLYNDRIACSVDIVGISNLVTFLEHTEAYRRDLRRVEYGDERDPKMRAYLESIAPMNHVKADQEADDGGRGRERSACAQERGRPDGEGAGGRIELRCGIWRPRTKATASPKRRTPTSSSIRRCCSCRSTCWGSRRFQFGTEIPRVSCECRHFCRYNEHYNIVKIGRIETERAESELRDWHSDSLSANLDTGV